MGINPNQLIIDTLKEAVDDFSKEEIDEVISICMDSDQRKNNKLYHNYSNVKLLLNH